MSSTSAVDAIMAQLAEDGHLAELRDSTMQHLRSSHFVRDLERRMSRRMNERLEHQRDSGAVAYEAFLDQTRRGAHVLIDRILNDVRVQAGHSYRLLSERAKQVASNAVDAYGLENSLDQPKEETTAIVTPKQTDAPTAALPAVLQTILDSRPSKTKPDSSSKAPKAPVDKVATTIDPTIVPKLEPAALPAQHQENAAAQSKPKTLPQAQDAVVTAKHAEDKAIPNSLLAKARALLEARSTADDVMTSAMDRDSDTDVSSVHTSDVSLSDDTDENVEQQKPAKKPRRKRKPSSTKTSGASDAKRPKTGSKRKHVRKPKKSATVTTEISAESQASTQPTTTQLHQAPSKDMGGTRRRSSRRLQHQQEMADESS
eukprot:m.24680 g.24680  ORF g.24680 m.24680 type:complete len:372 (-) comp11546_c0_seq1:12-1127(-)